MATRQRAEFNFFLFARRVVEDEEEGFLAGGVLKEVAGGSKDE